MGLGRTSVPFSLISVSAAPLSSLPVTRTVLTGPRTLSALSLYCVVRDYFLLSFFHIHFLKLGMSIYSSRLINFDFFT